MNRHHTAFLQCLASVAVCDAIRLDTLARAAGRAATLAMRTRHAPGTDELIARAGRLARRRDVAGDKARRRLATLDGRIAAEIS